MPQKPDENRCVSPPGEQSESCYALIDKVRKAGGWANFACNHRRVLSSLVSKLSAKNAARPIPVDAAGHVVDFWTPPGGY